MPYIDFKVRCEGIDQDILIILFIYQNIIFILYNFFSVIDDEATTVYTAGAIVTVTVQLKRRDMRVLFGDDSYADKHHIEPEKNAAKETEKPDKLEKPMYNGDVIENSENVENKELKDDEKEKKATKGIWQQKRQSGKGKKSGNVKKQKTTLSASAKKKIKKKEKLEKAKVSISLTLIH